MIDELLNKILNNLTEMSDPSMNTTLPRVEDIRPGITPLTFQSPLRGDTPKPILDQVPRVRNECKTKTKHPKQNNATSQNPTTSPNATATRTKRVSTVNL